MTGAALGQADRDRRWELLREPWGIVVIGGGITGAGILWEGARRGHRVLLLEQHDFASGTSSRSGQMVHGGLRYLRAGMVRLTWHSVRERERLLQDLPGLVRPLWFLLPLYRGAPVSGALLRVGLVIYDFIAGRRYHRTCSRPALDLLAPYIRSDGLRGALWYRDALTDDARLVLHAIREGERLGGMALNYARVEGLRRTHSGAVDGVVVRDGVGGRTVEVSAGVVISATGIWADRVRGWMGRTPSLRLLRGSHLIFPAWRLPVAQGLNLFHPVDGRPLYILPWESVTLVGTTDVDHAADPDGEARISPEERDYLLAALCHAFPTLDLSERDVLSTFSGVRAVVDTGRSDPSRASREHVVWPDDVITVTGGKLTTFRLLAHDALRHAEARLAGLKGRRLTGRRGPPPQERPPREPEAGPLLNDVALWGRLAGRYGETALAALEHPGEMEPVPGTSILWVELRLAAREAVVHLDDLLLRRLRLGLVLPQGAAPVLSRLRPIIQAALGWDDARWQAEVRRYVDLWMASHGPCTTEDSSGAS